MDPTATLIITEDAVIVGAENIEYKTCDGGEDCFSKTFTDLNTNRWHHVYTDYVIARGLMNGMSSTQFAPEANLTRGQLVTTLYRLAGEPEVTEPGTFADVAEGRYFTDAIAWAEDLGIAEGITETEFAPEGAVTREQAVTFLYRYVVNYLGQEPARAATCPSSGMLARFPIMPERPWPGPQPKASWRATATAPWVPGTL